MTPAEQIYAAYPRKEKRQDALRAIQKALKKIPFDELMEAVREYAESRIGQDRRYTPHPASWFNGERWTDDRTAWRLNDGAVGKSGGRGNLASRIADDSQDDAIRRILAGQETA